MKRAHYDSLGRHPEEPIFAAANAKTTATVILVPIMMKVILKRCTITL